MNTRDEVLEKFGVDKFVLPSDFDYTHLEVTNTYKSNKEISDKFVSIADEIVRLRTILDNLKGPSADVVEDVRVVANEGYGYRMPDDVLAALIRVAVDAAEEE